MSWSRVIAPWVGVCIITFSSFAYAQTRESINPLARPLRDVGFNRERVPEPLQHASADPYAMPSSNGQPDCVAINTEIAALNGVLGADLDMRIERREGVGDWVAGAVRGAIDVPYRNVVRRLSGADRREREMRNATQAGLMRRAFLRGIRDVNCSGELPPLQWEALAPDPAVISIATLGEAPAPPQTIVANLERTNRPAPTIVAEATPVALRAESE